jgi:hypothetical protein
MLNEPDTGARLSWKPAILCAVFSALLMGCGGETLAPVSGTVKYKGEAVKEGSLVFSPVPKDKELPGTPASANVKADGSYSLITGAGKGAVVGKHTVLYTPGPGIESKDPSKEGTPSPYNKLVVKTAEVEVKPGTNKIDFELEPAPPPKE